LCDNKRGNKNQGGAKICWPSYGKMSGYVPGPFVDIITQHMDKTSIFLIYTVSEESISYHNGSYAVMVYEKVNPKYDDFCQCFEVIITKYKLKNKNIYTCLHWRGNVVPLQQKYYRFITYHGGDDIII